MESLTFEKLIVISLHIVTIGFLFQSSKKVSKITNQKKLMNQVTKWKHTEINSIFWAVVVVVVVEKTVSGDGFRVSRASDLVHNKQKENKNKLCKNKHKKTEYSGGQSVLKTRVAKVLKCVCACAGVCMRVCICVRVRAWERMRDRAKLLNQVWNSLRI